MSQRYLKELIQKAREEMPYLQNDLQNASTHYALQDATQRFFNIFTLVLHNVIYTGCEEINGPPPVAPSTPPPPPVVIAPPPPAPIQSLPGILRLPPPNAITQPLAAAPAPIPGMSEINVQPGVTNVVITPHGTRVIAPTGASTVLPAGEAVDLAASTGRPIVPPAPPGVDNIVLPPGGGLTPDVVAALVSRTTPTE